MAARGMAIKPAGLQLSDALVRKARLARCRVIENERYRWGLGGEEGEEHGGVIENPTRAAFPRCRSVLIARNCVRASWNFLLPPVKKKRGNAGANDWPTSFLLPFRSTRSVRFADMDRSSNFFISRARG